MRRSGIGKIDKNFRWIDRVGAIRTASAIYRDARDFWETPISLTVACGRACGHDEPKFAGRYCTSVWMGDTRWSRFTTDVEKDIKYVDEIRKFLKRPCPMCGESLEEYGIKEYPNEECTACGHKIKA